MLHTLSLGKVGVVSPVAIFVAVSLVFLVDVIANAGTLTYDIPHVENFTINNNFNSWGESGLKVDQLATIIGTVQDPSIYESK